MSSKSVRTRKQSENEPTAEGLAIKSDEDDDDKDIDTEDCEEEPKLQEGISVPNTSNDENLTFERIVQDAADDNEEPEESNDEQVQNEEEEWLDGDDNATGSIEEVLGIPMESLIKGEAITEEDARMMQCLVCNLTVISFMMDEHKENCLGVEAMDNDTMTNVSMDEDALEEEEEEQTKKDISPDTKPNVNIKCDTCSKVFSKKGFERHNQQCSKPKVKYMCQVCNKMYSRPENLRQHLRAMHVDQTLKNFSVKCEVCSKVLKNKAVLTVHMRTHTGEKPFVCDFCPKAFPTRGAFEKHRRTHTGERPYECEQCHRKFTAKEVLNRHMQTHAKVKPHACSYCQKTFVQAMQLRAHMFYHTGEFSYHCSQCSASFHKQSNLSTHVKYEHNGARPLECNVCGKTFLTNNLLSRHKLTHSGRKDFKCRTCEKCFISKPALKTHELTHRREEPRICYDCGRAFIRLDCLIRHMRAKHRDILNEMITTAESNKIKQYVLSAQTKMEKGTNWNDDTFTANLRKLLLILIDQQTLANFGWPDRPIDKILDSLIVRCGSTPVVDDRMEYIDRLRENTKLLFTGIINDDALESLLNNNTVDEVVNYVLQLSEEKEAVKKGEPV